MVTAKEPSRPINNFTWIEVVKTFALVSGAVIIAATYFAGYMEVRTSVRDNVEKVDRLMRIFDGNGNEPGVVHTSTFNAYKRSTKNILDNTIYRIDKEIAAISLKQSEVLRVIKLVESCTTKNSMLIERLIEDVKGHDNEP